MYPLLTNFGVLLLGRLGMGKAPFVIILVEPRYGDTKMLRNQMRAYASNELAEQRVESRSRDTVIFEENFFSLLIR